MTQYGYFYAGNRLRASKNLENASQTMKYAKKLPVGGFLEHPINRNIFRERLDGIDEKDFLSKCIFELCPRSDRPVLETLLDSGMLLFYMTYITRVTMSRPILDSDVIKGREAGVHSEKFIKF